MIIYLIFEKFIEFFLHCYFLHWKFCGGCLWQKTNFCPTKAVSHSSEHTHTPGTHTQSSEQPFYAAAPGALLKCTSVMVLKVERALDIHSPYLQFQPARDSNPQLSVYESDTLTIRPRLLAKKDPILQNIKDSFIIFPDRGCFFFHE